MKTFKKLVLSSAIIASSLTAFSANAKDSYEVCWSHYTGWEPYYLLDQTGILQKWEDKYDIDIKVTMVNDYIESINLYTTGQFDACTMTNMDALTIPAVGGVDSTAIIMGDYSNGNDGVVIKNGSSIADLKGREVNLVELSVSHYLLSRALQKEGMSERDLTVVNTSDADIASLFVSNPDAAAVTWNPPLQILRNAKGANLVFDSSEVPEEIMDMLVVRSDVDEKFKKAMTGAWYELMSKLNTRGKESSDLIAMMASNSGSTVAEFKAQLKTTHMYYGAQEAAEVFKSDRVVKTMDYVRNFSFDHGLFGMGASNPDFVGIEFPAGKTLGNKDNIKLRFDPSYMEMAAKGEL